MQINKECFNFPFVIHQLVKQDFHYLFIFLILFLDEGNTYEL